jgi:glucose/arabinose dehydrogenase
LRSEALIRIKLQRSGKSYKVTRIERWFAFDKRRGKYGRLRDVVVGPDGNFYVLTSNRDGRGNPQPGDDKIYQIIFKK